MKLLKKLRFQPDGIEIHEFPALQSSDFQKLQDKAYSAFTPGRNAANQLARGIRWGILTKGGQLIWNDRGEYSLSAKENPEESGRIREFDLIPESFLRTNEIENTILDLFHSRIFPESYNARAYEVQLSGLRYNPTMWETSLPSPLIPHQDRIDGSIIVLKKTTCLMGGQSRIFDLDGSPLYEYDLDVGEALSLRDASYYHQVLPMMVKIDENYKQGMTVCRDILIVRIEPVGR